MCTEVYRVTISLFRHLGFASTSHSRGPSRSCCLCINTVLKPKKIDIDIHEY